MILVCVVSGAVVTGLAVCVPTGNNIGDDGARVLAEALSSMSGVRDLMLDLYRTWLCVCVRACVSVWGDGGVLCGVG